MYTPREIAIKRAFKLGKALDWDTDNTDDLLEFLKAVPVTDLVEAARKTLDLGVSYTICISTQEDWFFVVTLCVIAVYIITPVSYTHLSGMFIKVYFICFLQLLFFKLLQ